MNTTAKIAALSAVTLPVAGLTQLHWIVSHFSTVATAAAAVTVGAAVWGGKAIAGRRKASQVDERIQALAAEVQRRAELGQSQRVEYGGHVDYSVPVQGRIERER